MTNDEQTARGRGRPPKQHRDKLQTREMLLIAGTEVVTEKGFSAVGVDEILQRTGISRCSFYYYFKTKEGFGTELVERYRVSVIRKLERCLGDASRPLRDRLRAFVDEVRDGMVRTDCRSGCLVGKLAQEVNTLPENFRAQLAAVFADWQAALAHGLRLAQETGELSPELDCDRLAALFWYGWEGALQRANLELDTAPIDLFIEGFFSRLTR